MDLSSRRRHRRATQSVVKVQCGFTLIELMMALVITAVLAMIAMPIYESQQLRAKRSVAHAELMTIVARQEQFFVNNRRYAPTLADLGYADPWIVDGTGNQVTDTAPGRIYSITLASASATAFQLQAAPLARQARDTLCGSLLITSTGAKSQTGSGKVTECW
jgi:type IV pilus assembly protein PilE